MFGLRILRFSLRDEFTVLWHEIELWQRDNPAILSGYRPESRSYFASFVSLFYLHNESINVYSHLIGAIAFSIVGSTLYKKLKPLYKTASTEDISVFACFFIGCVFCLGTSALFHLVSNHSVAVSRWGNQLDYLGIVLLIWGSFIPSIYYGFQDRVDLIKLYWTVITIIGIATAYTSISPSFRTPEWRVIRAAMFTGMGVSAIFPVFHGLIVFGYEHLNHYIGLNWLLTQGFLYLLGASIYAARIPETLRPGSFDIFLHSHQIFHFLVLAAAAAHLQGLVKAFHSKHRGPNACVKVGGGRMKTD